MFEKVTITDGEEGPPSLLLTENSQHKDIPPEELSGDENADNNILVTSNAFSHTKASLFLSVTILMKTIIGVGILSLPFIFSTMGIIPTLVTFLFAGLMTQFSSNLLLKSKNMSSHSNYSTIMHHLHRHNGYKIFVSLIIMSGSFGACILDLMFFKATLRKILTDVIENSSVLDEFYTSQYMILLAIAVIQFPIVLLKKIERLRMFSLVGISGIVVFILTFLVDYSIQMSNGEGIVTLEMFPKDWYKALATVPTIIFSLTFQSNFFPIFKGLEKSSDKRMLKVSLIGTVTCISCYLTLGFLGYSITKGELTANFLESISYKDTNIGVFLLMNIGFLLSLFFAFPIIFFSCKINFLLIVKLVTQSEETNRLNWRQEDSGEQISYESNQSANRKSKIHYYVSVSILFVVIIVIAMLVNSLESIFNLVGSISCSCQSMLFPLYFYLKLIYKKNKEKRVIYYIAMVLLLIMTPFSVFSIVALYI